MNSLQTFNHKQFSAINAERAELWHGPGTKPWTLLEWASAMCGEAGEVANVAKKLHRVVTGTARQDVDVSALNDHFVEELADVATYLDLLCTKAGFTSPLTPIDIGPAIEPHSRMSVLALSGRLCRYTGLMTTPAGALYELGDDEFMADKGLSDMQRDVLTAAALHEGNRGARQVFAALVHLAHRIDRDLPLAMVTKFNQVSQKQAIDIVMPMTVLSSGDNHISSDAA